MASTYTVQNVADDLRVRGDLNPQTDMAGYSTQPIFQICTTVMQEMTGGKTMFPFKWNEFNLPQFYMNSWQQDYALPGLTNLAWLTQGMAIDINNPSMPKPYAWVEVGRDQPRQTGTYISNSIFQQPICVATFKPNSLLIYGTWGAAQTGNATWGNNPQANQVISSPLGNGTPMPNNPILQIIDANDNYLVLTTYGTTGAEAPSAPADSDPGTTVDDGSCVWTVIDPDGQGIRLSPVPSQTGPVWQINLVGQLLPVKFTDMTQTLDPMPDDFYPHFLDGCVVQAIRYNSNPRTRATYPLALQAWRETINEMRKEQDREKEEYRIIPSRSVLGAGGNVNTNFGPFWPFGYPVS